MLNQNHFKILSLFVSLLTPLHLSLADDSVLSFPEVWRAIRESSPSERAAIASAQAADIASDRSGRHWYPRVFMDAKAFSTNDPTATFFEQLSEKQITTGNFNPSLLNNPGSNFFTDVGFGLDLPVCEGGARVAENESKKTISQAKSLMVQVTLNEDYLSATQQYGKLIAVGEQEAELKSLQETVTGVINRYQLGGRGNPVGYSGLLGLKGLRNRIAAALIQNHEEALASKESLSQMASHDPMNWQPKPQPFLEFIRESLPALKSARDSSSASVKSSQMLAKSQEQASDAEKAKFLPKVGLFAHESINSGSLGTGNAYSAGAYLQWNLFSATDYGSIHEAELRNSESSAHADAQALAEGIQKTQARHADTASEQSIRLMTENVKLLAEQTDSSRKLYQSGAINALQFLEVLSRRADLLSALTQAELTLLSARESQLRTSEFEVPRD